MDEESKVNRFHRELIRAEAQDIRVIILIENINWYSDVLKHNYRSKIKPSAARGLIMSLEAKYSNVIIKEIEKEKAASSINSTLYYALREQCFNTCYIVYYICTRATCNAVIPIDISTE